MILRCKFALNRMHAGWVIGVCVLCSYRAPAQTVSPTQTVYAVCTASTAPSQYVYITSVFSVANSVGRKLRESFEQYVRAQYANINVGSVNCGASESQEKAEAGRQNAVNAFNQAAQKLGVGHSPQLVEIQWQYQQSSAQAAAPVPAAAAPASQSTSSAAGANPAQALSNSTGAVGKNIQKSTEQSVNQSVQSMENTSTSTLTGAMTGASNSVNSSVQQGIGGLRNKLFHKSSPAPSTTSRTTPAPVSAKVSPVTAPTNPQPPSANPAPASTTMAAQPGPALSIQDEGDGKHSLLVVPGQSDAHELTLVEGTKNVYLEEATGDKYIVMSNGKIMRVPHKPVAAAAK